MAKLLYPILSISLISLLFVNNSVANDYNKIALGAKFVSARSLLSAGKPGEGLNALESLTADPGLKLWSSLYIVEAKIAQSRLKEAKGLWNKLKQSDLSPFAGLYHKKLGIELSLLNDERPDLTQIERDLKDLANERSKLLQPEISYLSALTLCKRERYGACVRSLQDTRVRYPASIAAEKAYQVQNKILQRSFKYKEAVTVPAFWQTEAGVLTKRGKFKEADQIWTSYLVPASTKAYTKSLFDLRLKILRGLGDSKSVDNFIAQMTQKGSPVRTYALTEQVNKAWNSNKYPEVERLLTALGRTPYTMYMRARIAEEQLNIEGAKALYQKLSKIKGQSYRFASGLRLGLLYLRENKIAEAQKVFQEIKRYDPKSNYYDSVALEYWLNVKGAGKEKGLPLSFKNDPRLYYYWLTKGVNIERPTLYVTPESEVRLPKDPRCHEGHVYLDNDRRKHLKILALYGVNDLLREELTFTLRDDGASLGEVRARAKFISDIGSPSEGIKELRSSQDKYALMEKNCLGSLMEILYPRDFEEIFFKEAKRVNVDPYILMAIARTESAFDPLAVSSSGAVGLMQLMPFTAELEGFKGYKEGSPEQVFNPAVNIALGANHIRRLLDKYGENWHLVIAAYNAGGEAVDRWLKRYPNTKPEVLVELITYKETRNYVKKVLGAYWAYLAVGKKTEA